MSTDSAQEVYKKWQMAEKRHGKLDPDALYWMSLYTFYRRSSPEWSALADDFLARLNDYHNWKNTDIQTALVNMAYVLYYNHNSKAAYPLILRAKAIGEYLRSLAPYDMKETWLTYVYILRDLQLYEQEALIAKKLYKYYLEKEGERSDMVVHFLLRLDFTLYKCGRYAEAKRYCTKALELQKKYHSSDEETTLIILSNLSFDLAETGPREEEIRIREEYLALLQKQYGRSHKKAIEAYELLCAALSKYCSNGLSCPEDLRTKAIDHHNHLLELKTSAFGRTSSTTLDTKRDLIAVLERIGHISDALRLQEELVVESKGHNDPDKFPHNRDRYRLIELYRRYGSLDKAVALAEDLLSDLTANLDRKTLEQSVSSGKRPDPSIDIKGIMMTRVFLQKYLSPINSAPLKNWGSLPLEKTGDFPRKP